MWAGVCTGVKNLACTLVESLWKQLVAEAAVRSLGL